VTVVPATQIKNETSNKKPLSRGILLIVIASVLWSTSGFFTQLKVLDAWSVETRGPAIAFWRACFALVLLLSLVRAPSLRWAMIPMTLCFAGMNWTFLTAIVSGSPANTIWLQNLAPAWVMLASVLIFRESPSYRDWIMLTTCIAGVLFILVMEQLYGIASPNQRWWAPVLALLSGVFYAGVILSIRGLRDCEPAWLAALNHIVTALLMLPIVVWSGASLPSGWMWLVLACLGMLQMGFPYYLFSKGLQTTPGHVASLITLLEPVLLPVWVHLTRFNDPSYQSPSWWTWVGAGLIMIGLSVRNLLPATNDSEKGTE
jgi:drug/metabolite transporter, DME family